MAAAADDPAALAGHSGGRPPLRSKAALTAAIRRDARVVLVVNTRSRRAGGLHGRLPEMLAAAGVPLLADLPVSDPGTLPAALEQALSMRPDLLVLGGGDGTMATAVEFLAYRDIALGVLPLGTTNNFARSLGLPLGIRGAVRTIGAGSVADVDLGHAISAAGEKLFANLVSLGLSVEVARRTPHRLKRRLGRAAYALTAARILPRHQPFLATVSTATAKRTFWTHQVNVANGRYHAGRAIARDASIDDRLLVAYRLGDRRRWGLSLAMVDQVLHGARRPLAATQFLVGAEIGIATTPALKVDVDGEVWGTTPLTIRIAGQALRVLVSADFVDT